MCRHVRRRGGAGIDAGADLEQLVAIVSQLEHAVAKRSRGVGEVYLRAGQDDLVWVPGRHVEVDDGRVFVVGVRRVVRPGREDVRRVEVPALE